jgi:hypothetical protein
MKKIIQPKDIINRRQAPNRKKMLTKARFTTKEDIPSVTKCRDPRCGTCTYSHQKHYFVKYHSDSTHKYSEVEIKKMLGFLVDNIYVVVGGQVFQHSWIRNVPLS